MARLKAHEVDRFLKQGNKDYHVVLIYGPDAGLVSERAKIFAKTTGVDLNDPFAVIKLEADEAASDTARIADEANTIGMFGGSRLIWIRGSTQKNLANCLTGVLEDPPQDAYVIIEAGDLRPTAALRKKCEAAKSAITLPCFADEGASLDQLIKEELASFNLTIDQDSKQALKGLIGGNRLASRSELQKLCLYAQDKGKIELEDIKALVGDASSFAMDEVIDAAAIGNLDVMLDRFNRLTEGGTPVFVVLGAILRHFQALHKAKAEMIEKRKSAHAVVDQWRPPLHFKRKPQVTAALERWTLPKLQQALERLEKANFETRNNAQLATSLANTTLLAIGMQANGMGANGMKAQRR